MILNPGKRIDIDTNLFWKYYRRKYRHMSDFQHNCLNDWLTNYRSNYKYIVFTGTYLGQVTGYSISLKDKDKHHWVLPPEIIVPYVEDSFINLSLYV